MSFFSIEVLSIIFLSNRKYPYEMNDNCLKISSSAYVNKYPFLKSLVDFNQLQSISFKKSTL